ncbi:YsnF/AvaK domain-containing protein [Leptodesmis sp.]|uniref:YsnF/AvaK domain-containing protein n=1 Tax=Leptodesmis sp. TaxID=3100501 RepID=UPI0040535193
MSNQYSARPIDSSDSDSDRLRTLLDNLNNLKSKLHHFTVIDELGQPLGEITDLILDAGHQLNLVIALADATSVLLNGRRIKKVSVQTQSVFVDITKADTQFLPEYSSSEGAPSLEALEQTASPASAASSPDLSFLEESSFPEHSAFLSEEHPAQPTAADLELAQSLFTTEPEDSISSEVESLSQNWELSSHNQSEDVFADWGQNGESATPSFSFAPESSESLASELEHLDLQLDNDWSELGTFAEPEDTSNSFELNLDLESLTPEPQALDVSEEDLLGTESLAADESVNPFAGALPDLNVDATFIPAATEFTTASAEELPNLDWTDTATSQEAPDFTLENADFAFDLPASETSDASESVFPETSAPESEAFAESLNLADQVLGLQEPVTSPVSEDMSPASSPDFTEPDTISSLTDLDIISDHPDTVEDVAPTFDALIDQPSDQLTDSPLNLEPIDFQSDDLLEQPSDISLAGSLDVVPDEEFTSPPVSDEQDNLQLESPPVNEPEIHGEWLAAAGVGAAGPAAEFAAGSSPDWNQEEPVENAAEEITSAPAQPAEELNAELPLLEEQLNVEYQRRKVGEVIIRKQIETRMVQVPVRYEKLIIEQVSPEQKSLAEVDLSQGALDNIELTGTEDKPTVTGEFTSPAVASQALEAIAKALQNRCKSVRIEIELEDGKLQQTYQEWLDQCSQL